jgi:hypothetical protein
MTGLSGKRGTKEEKMFNSQRFVPLFEFRDLENVFTNGMEDFMGRVEKAIQELHNNFANAPGKKVRRGVCGNAEPEPQPEPEPEPTGPTKQLAVLSSFVLGAPTLDWLFLEADFEQGVGCREDLLRPFDTEPWDFSANGAQTGSTFPGGIRELDLTIDGQKCQYQNDGDDPGAVLVWREGHWLQERSGRQGPRRREFGQRQLSVRRLHATACVCLPLLGAERMKLCGFLDCIAHARWVGASGSLVVVEDINPFCYIIEIRSLCWGRQGLRSAAPLL